MDPLAEQDALQEAQLVELLFDPVTRRLGLLFDLRQALQLRLANTGLMTFDAVEQLSWSAAQRATPRTAWTVVGSVPAVQGGSIKLELFFVPDAELHVLGRGAVFYVGQVAGLPAAPPDFTDGTPEMIAKGMASMRSSFEPKYMTRLGSLG